ncbi:MAG: hypothetical protein M3461_06970 [Pseudomonadota bacterium]|nr:hypothetical protein [Pseudomonadota bacterium]
MTSIAPMAAGGTSAGGLAALALTRFSKQGLAELKALADHEEDSNSRSVDGLVIAVPKN